MAGKRGQFQRPLEWAKHLRKVGKRFYWKGERAKSKQNIKKDEGL
jgi:hypothetical protein